MAASIQSEQRMAALDALLARGGQGRVASNPMELVNFEDGTSGYRPRGAFPVQQGSSPGGGDPGDVWDSTIRPALTGPPSERADRTRRMWDDRNASVSQANRAMVGGYGSALNSARVQGEEEWMREYNDKLAKSRSRGAGGGGGGGGGGGDDAPSWSTPQQTDPWAWLDDYLNNLPTGGTPPPAPLTTRPTTRPRLPAPGQGGGARYM